MGVNAYSANPQWAKLADRMTNEQNQKHPASE